MNDDLDGWTGQPPEALLQADNARYAAMLAGDVQALEQLLADGLVYTHSDGTTDDKAAYLASVASQRLKYLRCERGALAYRPLAGGWLSHGTVRLQALLAQRPVSVHIHFLAAWRPHACGAWQLAAWASTRMPDA